MADVGCVGIVVDDTFCGPMKTLPSEGQLLAIENITSHVGGCAANVAMDIAKQGFSVELAGCAGDDPSADYIRENIEAAGVRCSGLIKVPSYQTSKTVILLVEGQDRRYIHVFGANAAMKVSHISRDWVAGLRVLYIGGLCAMPGMDFDELRELFKYCRHRGVITVLDVVIPHDFLQTEKLKTLLTETDYFLPNDDEAAILTGQSDVSIQLKTLQSWCAGSVIITRGSEGAMATDGKTLWTSGIYRMNIVDPSGSGDAFAAGVIAGILEKASMPSMLRYGSALGASATQAIGTTSGVFDKKRAKEFIAANKLEITCEKLK